MRKLVPIVLALVFAAPAASVTGTGLRGTVRMTPSGACLQDASCGKFADDVMLVFSRNGRVMRRAMSNDQGRYRTALATGIYSVSSPALSGPRARITPSRVQVVAGRYRTVDFVIDTGVRAP